MPRESPNACQPPPSSSPLHTLHPLLLFLLLLLLLFFSTVEPATVGDAVRGEAKPQAALLDASARALWRWKSNISSTAPLSSWELDAVGNYSSSAPCSWRGVVCSDAGGVFSVTRIDLSRLRIAGTLDELDFEALLDLTHLNLSHNQLQGRIPGALPAQLVSLDLHNNCFSSNIPASIGNLTKLQVLDVSVNCLQAPLPREMANLKSLFTLNISDNKIGVGVDLLSTIALDLNLAFTLTSLDIGWNRMTGEIPEPALYALGRLKYLSASGNNFSGGIPAAIRNLQNLTYLSLYNCSLSGPIPKELTSLHSLEILDLAQNHFSGPIPPDLSKLRNLKFLKLSYNNLTGEIPPQLGNLSALQFFKLKGNRLSGSVIAELCRLKSLRIISLSNNMLSGGIPACLGTMNSLLVIDLRNNRLSGEIPTELCSSLPLLEVINFSNNTLTGAPPNLTKCQRIVSLDLGENKLQGPISEWLLGEERSPLTLKILRLTFNAFSGPIPPQLSRLQSLQYLDISNNNLSGPIPPELGKLQAMKKPPSLAHKQQELSSRVPRDQYIDGINVVRQGRMRFYREVLAFLSGIDLSGNNLSGSIPREVMGLAGMKLFNLSRNDLSGPIPPEIGGLASMESMDLSRNHLSGPIPENISRLNFLNTLNLSDNQLSGMIPVGPQLQGQNASAYGGNPGLCGRPLPISCDNSRDGKPSDRLGKELHRKLDMENFWWGSIPGAIVGMALAICGNLILTKKACETEGYPYTNYLVDSSLFNSDRPLLR